MLTLIGKLFAFLNLVVGVGMCMWAINVYTNRPSYFDKDIPEAIEKGNSPESFVQFKAEIDSLGKAASGAIGAWGDALKTVEARETTRADRQRKLAARLKTAREGDAKGVGFYELVEDPVTKLIDVDKVGPVVLGPPPPGETVGQPLRGADRLLDSFNRDAQEIARLAAEIKTQRLLERDLQRQVQDVEVRYLKQMDIRENLHNEFSFLSGFEVNVYEDRETVYKRKRQLLRQLERFDPKKRD